MATVEEYMDEVLKVKLSEKGTEYYQKEWKEETAAKKLKFVQESFRNVSRQSKIKTLTTSQKVQTSEDQEVKEEKSSSVPHMVTKKPVNTASLQDKILYVEFGDSNSFSYELHRALKVAQTLKNNILYNYTHKKEEPVINLAESQVSVEPAKEKPVEVELQQNTMSSSASTAHGSEEQAEIDESSMEKPKKAARNGIRRAKVKKYTALKIRGEEKKEEKFKLVPTPSEPMLETQEAKDETTPTKAGLISEIEKQVAVPINEPPKYTNSDIFENITPVVDKVEDVRKTDNIIIVPERASEVKEKTTDIHFDVTNATSEDLKKATAMTTDIGKLKEYLVRATKLKEETELVKKQAEARRKEAEMQKQQLIETAQKLEEYTRALAENKTRIEQEAQKYSQETEEYNRTMAEMLEAMQPSQESDVSSMKSGRRVA